MSTKSVLITGASRGIGKACAFAFAKAGYQVFINSHSSSAELENVRSEIEASYGPVCVSVPGDVSRSAEVNDIFSKIYTHTDALDVLINNAGIAHFGLLFELTDEEWHHIIDTNLSSTFYCCRKAVPPMIHRKSGHIVNISSMWGTVGASCEAAYSASKSGIHGLTKALAKELAPSGISVNAIACGVVDTQMNQMLSAEELSSLADEIPAGRFATPEEIAQIVLSLCTCPAYLTGQIIGADGGYI